MRRRSVTSLGEAAGDGNSASSSAIARRGTGPEPALVADGPPIDEQGQGNVPPVTPVTTRSAAGAGRPGRFAPSNWRVRWRLAAVIAIPTIAAAVLGAITIASNASSAAAFGRVQTLANLNAAVVTLSQNLEDERVGCRSIALSGRR